MRNVLILLSLVAALTPGGVRADTRNGLSNAIAVESTVDCVETTAALRSPRTFEVDPLAKPVAHSLPLCLGAAGAINLWLRSHHGPTPFVLRAVVALYPVLLWSNNRVLVRIRYNL